MVLELRQQLKLSQQLIMTPQLQMAIKLLQLSRLELMDTIQQELEENPALEETIDAADDIHTDPVEPEPIESGVLKEVTIGEKINDDIDWSNYIDEYNSPGKANFEFEKKEQTSFESFIAKKESLTEHLLWQFMMTAPSMEEEAIGSLIIGNLDKDGYLKISIEDIAETSNSSPEKIQQVLSVLQTFDPVGVCARNLSECLMIQVKALGLKETIVTEIINHHLAHLENKNYKAICKALKTDIENVISAVRIIQGLEPRPGREFSDEEPIYIVPDIYVYKVDDDFVIVLNNDGMPRLRINPFYKASISQNDHSADSARDYIQDKMRSAAWLIRSIQQRQKTIYKVMESILLFQKDFFEKGISYLKPMVLKNVAQDIGMHESTISRVTTNKYAHTPQGIFELKYFFNSSINRMHGGTVASASVMDKIRQIIESENSKKPYSDNKIAEMLKESNIDIARRTVAKYREMLKVLPSNKRKQY